MIRLERGPRGLALPLEIATEANGILATRGAGKSYASAVEIEELHDSDIQVVVLDPAGVYWGLTSSADGKKAGLPFYVLGGEHGDLHLEPHAGATIADTVVDTGESFVLDFSGFETKADMVRFVTAFAERLYYRKGKDRTPIHLVVDEADEFAPQKPMRNETTMLSNVERLVKRGRSRGIGVTLITQRSQAINKSVLDLIETLVVMRMLSPRSVAAVKEWITAKDLRDELGVTDSLPGLETGTAWVWSPLRGILKQVRVRRIRTFDSYATPKPGEKRAEPLQRTPVDLDALGEKMRATVERARENDPAELRKQLAIANRRIDELVMSAAERPEPETIVERVEVPAISGEQLLSLVTSVNQLRTAANPIAEALQKVAAAAEAPSSDVGKEEAEGTERAVRGESTVRAELRRLQPRRVRATVKELNGDLGGGAPRKMLAVLAQFPDGRSQNQLAILSGYSRKSSTFRNGLSRLRSLGYAEGSAPVRITAAGMTAAGEVEPLPTGRELYLYWREQLGDGAPARFLDVLYTSWPKAVEKVSLAQEAGYSVESSTFRNGLSRLRSLELAHGSQQIKASDVFFEGARR